jgi:hypothetical protein
MCNAAPKVIVAMILICGALGAGAGRDKPSAVAGAAAAETLAAALAADELPELHPRVSWLGNTFSGTPLPQFIPLSAEDIAVSSDGIVATNANYNEGVTAVITLKEGKYFGCTNHQILGLVNRAVVAEDPDGEYLFYSSYHAMGTGVGRVLPSGRGDPKNVVMEAAHNWPAKGFSGRIVTGLAVRDHLLFVSDATPRDLFEKEKRESKDGGKSLALHWEGFQGISVVDMRSLNVLRSFPLQMPGKLAADHGGNVWVIQGQGAERLNRPTRVLKLSGKTGAVLATLDAMTSAGAVAVDGADRLLVADRGPEANIKIYTADGQPAGFFGTPGGIFAPPTPGLAGPARFESPRGVGVDAQNNLYVLSVGACWPAVNRIECYAPRGSGWGPRKWQALGMMFGDVATFDPHSDDLLYTSCAVLKMDWSREAGQEWSYFGATLAPQRDDPRRGIFAQGFAGRSTFGVRYIQGHKFLWSGLNNVEVCRFDERHGWVATAAVYVALRDPQIDKAAANWPSQPTKLPAWIWRDRNGNGTFDDGEYEPLDVSWANKGVQAHVDLAGNIWWFPDQAGGQAHFLPVSATLDEKGNPVYRPKDLTAVAVPAGYSKYGFFQYDDTTGDLYVVGKRLGEGDYSLARYPGWRANPAQAAALWSVAHLGKHMRSEIWIPTHTDIGSVAVAGDYVFVASAIDNAVRVYGRDTGALVGWMHTTLSHPTTMDCYYGFQVRRRDGGEYVLILMDYYHNKNLIYRWTPQRRRSG